MSISRAHLFSLAFSFSLPNFYFSPFVYVLAWFFLAADRFHPPGSILVLRAAGLHFFQFPPPKEGWAVPLDLGLFKPQIKNMIGLSGIRCLSLDQSIRMGQQNHTTGGTSVRLGMSREYGSSWVDYNWISHLWRPTLCHDLYCAGFLYDLIKLQDYPMNNYGHSN